MNSTIIRILTFILVFFLVSVLPWWLSAIILVGLTIYFPLYLEVLFFGFFFDALYAVRYTFPYTGLSVATVFLLVVIFVKTQVRR